MKNDLVVLVSNPNGLTHISSRTVADLFEREHKNVLRQIENLMGEEVLLSSLSELSEYTDTTGRTLPMYLLTESGFTVLVSTFNLKTKEDKEIRKSILKQFHEKQLKEIQQTKQLKEENAKLKNKRLFEQTETDEYGTRIKKLAVPVEKKTVFVYDEETQSHKRVCVTDMNFQEMTHRIVDLLEITLEGKQSSIVKWRLFQEAMDTYYANNKEGRMPTPRDFRIKSLYQAVFSN